MEIQNQKLIRFDWVDGVKAFAILAILLNHFVELYFGGPWFSNPSYSWSDITTRLGSLFPHTGNWVAALVIFLGWLGDMGPGVFIVLSGFTLVLSQQKNSYPIEQFYKKRLLRIFPLYIAIHLLVLLFLFVASPDVSFSPIKIFLSVLGLRFTDGLFFYINPSWWFIWLIVQLYLVFPFLFKLLKVNKNLFLLITLVFTVLSRLAGLLHFTYSENLYYWMTGLFFGTRLFEFSAGMYFATLFYENKKSFLDFLNNRSRVLLVSSAIYVVGFICSWFYIGTLLSNILISLGLTGIFYSLFEFVRQVKFRKVISIIGILSFPVFLIHQPFMIFIAGALPGKVSVISNILFVVLCFPIGYILNLSVEKAIEKSTCSIVNLNHFLQIKKVSILLKIAEILLLLGILINVVAGFGEVLDKFLFALSLVILVLIYFSENGLRHRFSFILLLIILSGFFIVLFPFQWIHVYVLLLLSGFLIVTLFKKLNTSVLFATVYLILAVSVISFGEIWFRENQSIEINRWGEYPALQKDERTVYSLIPNKKTRLRYNNYDYTINTNSLGFNSPDIDLNAPKDSSEFRIFIVGDAFTMPESMEYQFAYPYLLEEELNKKYPNKKIKVINGGVTGYGPNEMLGEVRKYIDTLKPDLVIDEMFVNEFLEINLSREERLESIGLNQDSYQEEMFGYSQLSYQVKKVVRKMFNVQYPENKYKKSLMYFYEKNSEYVCDSVAEMLDNFFTELKSTTDSANCKLLVLYVPGQIEVSSPANIEYYPVDINLSDTNRFDFQKPNDIIRELCSKNKIDLFDSEDTLRNHPIQPVYYTGSWHWNKEGQRVISEALLQIIKPK